jgi:hypothetical protein
LLLDAEKDVIVVAIAIRHVDLDAANVAAEISCGVFCPGERGGVGVCK